MVKHIKHDLQRFVQVMLDQLRINQYSIDKPFNSSVHVRLTLAMKKPVFLTNACLTTIVLLAILCIDSSTCSDHHKYKQKHDSKSMVKRYENWLKRHGRRYGDKEEWNLRFGIYQSNVELVEFINSLNLSYQLTDNEFADLTNHEFKSKYLGYKKHRHSHHHHHNFTFDTSNMPTSVDWRKSGAVNPIKNQGNCGSCWAFSAIAAVESINKIKTGKLVSLSEQEIVDCDVDQDDQGCNGGYMEKAYEFIKKNGGVTTEKDYPYTGTDGKCDSAKEKDHAVTISGYSSVPRSNEEALQAAVVKQPVSVAIDASGYDFQLYSKGVFTGQCGKTLNHGVAIIGYGLEDGEKYWLVRNSWGSNWGEEGYIKMKRGANDKSGICGITMEASYPLKE